MRPWMEEALAAREALGAGPDRQIFFNAKHRSVAIATPPGPVIDTHAHLTMMGGDGKTLTDESLLAGADALALDAEEGRDRRRNPLGRRLRANDPGVSEWGNPAGRRPAAAG